jgi:hypothetical protein
VKPHLGDISICTASSLFNEITRCLKREEDDFGRTVSRPQSSGYLKAIHCGHGNIEYRKFRLMRLNGSEGRFTIFGLGDDSVRWLQQTSQHLQDFSIVVSDNDSRLPIIVHPTSTTRPCGKFPYLVKKIQMDEQVSGVGGNRDPERGHLQPRKEQDLAPGILLSYLESQIDPGDVSGDRHRKQLANHKGGPGRRGLE